MRQGYFRLKLWQGENFQELFLELPLQTQNNIPMKPTNIEPESALDPLYLKKCASIVQLGTKALILWHLVRLAIPAILMTTVRAT